MKKVIYALILLLVVVGGLVFANREVKNEINPSPKPLSAAEKKAALEYRKRWDASADGIKFKMWESSPEGKKVHASNEKIGKELRAFTKMEAVVTSVSFRSQPIGKPGPKWLIVDINGENYMMQYGAKDFKQLSTLKVNDKILVRSRSAGRSPNHPYLIISGDYIEHNSKVLFKRVFKKNGRC
jgi:hypothetical protein